MAQAADLLQLNGRSKFSASTRCLYLKKKKNKKKSCISRYRRNCNFCFLVK